jgi:hypothetical protein
MARLAFRAFSSFCTSVSHGSAHTLACWRPFLVEASQSASSAVSYVFVWRFVALQPDARFRVMLS